ncbi:MAG: PEGA domain-containing protein, partial [Polyangia bacterium]
RAAAPEGAARAPTPLAVNSDASAAGLDGGAATAAGARGAPAGVGGGSGALLPPPTPAPAAGNVPAAGAASLMRPTPTPTPTSTLAPDEDETRLLGRVVPDAAAVVGEDEAEDNAAKHGATNGKAKEPGGGAAEKPVAAVPRAGAGGPVGRVARTAADQNKQGSAGRSSSATRSSDTAATRVLPVQVRITSSPLGAVVRTKKQVLGRTPLAVHFNPGNTYELTFVKGGYVTKNRRLAVRSGKPQSISVAMRKAPPPPRRSFFFHRR